LNSKSENGIKTANVSSNYTLYQPGVNHGEADNPLFIGLPEGNPQILNLLFKAGLSLSRIEKHPGRMTNFIGLP
jgi:hypothetical protein